MKQLILRHHAEPDGSNPTITVIYQSTPTHVGTPAGPLPFDLAISEKDRELLRWYLEEYLLCPLAVYRDMAKTAESRMRGLGEELFAAVFREKEPFSLYNRVSNDLPNTRIIVQANTASGIALPWELIRDPYLDVDLSYEAGAFVRGEENIKREPVELVGDRVNVLLAISRPDGEEDVAFQSVARHLLEAFANQSGRVHIEVLRPATFEELGKRLRAQTKEFRYHVFHFDGHGVFRPNGAPGTMRFGEGGGQVAFEDRRVTGAELGRVLAAAKVPLVLLNACQSGMTRAEDGVVSLGNELLRSGACGVVAMSYSVYVQTAAAFMKNLYENLRDGDDLAGAHKKSIATLRDSPARISALGTEENLQDWIVPVLFESVPVTPLPKQIGSRYSSAATVAEAEEFGVPQPPEYGFHGRDNVTLRLERVFQNNTVALLWGMAGVGKTTTAAAFARWWARTGALEGPVFFFSFEYHKTLAAVVGEIGRAYHAMLKANGIEWEHLSPKQQRRCVLDLLTQIPCFVIFDNFEPVSGFPTGTPSVWTTEEQDELREFLAELTRRKAASKVLITSRRETEPVLPPCPIIPLGGLPRHEALEMAGAILTRHGLTPTAIRKLPAFDDLLKFLKGNPLSLQVILPLLADGTKPEALLTRLQAGTVALPVSDTTAQGRDTSLTASLTYRLESLSSCDTARLSVIGLFQGFVDADILAMLSSADAAPAEIVGLSADDWTGILSVAAEIGLMRVVGKGYFTIHPALPWFFHENLTTTFGDRLPALEKLFARVYGQYASWLDDQFETNPRLAMSLLSAEESNNLHALRLAQMQQQDGAISGILYGIKRLWKTQGRWEEFDRLLSNVESEAQNATGEPKGGRDHLWIVCLGMRQEIAHYRRDFKTVKTMLLRLKNHYETVGDEKNVATALHQLGIVAQEHRNFDDAEKWYRQSMEIKQRIGDEHGLAQTLHQLGRIAQERRNFDGAEKWYRQSMEINERIGNEHGLSGTLHQLGMIAEERRNFDDAEKWYKQAEAIFLRENDPYSLAVVQRSVARLAEARQEG